MDPILDNIDADIQAGLEYLEEQAQLQQQERTVDPEAPQPEAPQPQKKVPYKQSQGYLNALNGIEPTEADLEPYAFMERADINSTWMKNARKAKDPSQYDLTDNTYEMFDAIKGGAAKTWSSVLTFPERVVDMASGAYEREVQEKGKYTPDFDPLSLSDYDPKMKTWWGPILANGVHFYGLGRMVSRSPAGKLLPSPTTVKGDVVIGAIGSAISAESQQASMTQQLYDSKIVAKVPWAGEFLQEQVVANLPTRTKPEDHPLLKTFKNVVEGMGMDAVIGRILARFDTALEARGTRLNEMRRANIENQKFEAAKAENDAIEANLPQQTADLQQATEALNGLEAQAKGMPDGPQKDQALAEIETLKTDLQTEAEMLQTGKFSAYTNPDMADPWQGAPNSMAESVVDQAAQTKRLHESYPIDGAGSTDSMFTPVQSARMATESGMLESEIKGLAKRLMKESEFEFAVDSARKLGKSFKEAYGYSFERIQEVLGRDKTAVDAEDFWKPFFDEAVQYPNGATAWLTENVVMADMINASLFSQLRDLGLASKELAEIADLRDIDGPFKTIADRLIVGLTNVKRSRYIWGSGGQSLRGKLLANKPEGKAELAEITEAYRAESEAVVNMMMKLAENAKDNDTILALADVFAKADKPQNWMDLDAFMRNRLTSGGLNQEPGYLVKELASMQVNSMLSSVKTPQRAIIGTFSSGFFRNVAQTVGGFARLDTDAGRANAAALNAYFQAIPEAWSVFKNNLGSYWAGDVKTIQNRFQQSRRVADDDWEAQRAWTMTRGNMGDQIAFGLADWARTLNDPRNLLGRIATASSSSLSAGDDAFRVIMGRARARERAMRQALDDTKVGKTTEVNENLLRQYEDNFYKEYLDDNGNLNFESDAYLQASFEEATLTKDLSGFGAAIQNMMESTPYTAPFFRFARTGINGLMVSYKNTPLLGLVHKESIDILRANADNLDNVRKYGINTVEDLENAKALIAGRQAVGGTLTTMASLHYLNGGLTGDGPLDPQQRKIWESTGWQPRSIKIGNVWVSYELFEPFNNILASIANTGDSIRLMGPEWGAKSMGEIALAVGQGAMSKSYLQGLGQFADLFTTDFSRQQKVLASLANNTIPLAGLRGDLGKLINPYMREINNSWWETLRNRNLSSELLSGEPLPMKFDVLNGQPVRDWNFMERMWNAGSAFNVRFEQSPGRTLLHNSNYDMPLAVTRSFDGLDLSDYPQFRSWFQEEMGKHRVNGKSLEDELNGLAERPEVKESVRIMYDDIRRGDRSKDPMQAYMHNTLINDRVEKWRDAAWAAVRRKHPEVEVLYQTREERERNTYQTFQKTMQFLR